MLTLQTKRRHPLLHVYKKILFHQILPCILVFSWKGILEIRKINSRVQGSNFKLIIDFYFMFSGFLITN